VVVFVRTGSIIVSDGSSSHRSGSAPDGTVNDRTQQTILISSDTVIRTRHANSATIKQGDTVTIELEEDNETSGKTARSVFIVKKAASHRR
jgi:hypothetical protein